MTRTTLWQSPTAQLDTYAQRRHSQSIFRETLHEWLGLPLMVHLKDVEKPLNVILIEYAGHILACEQHVKPPNSPSLLLIPLRQITRICKP